MRPPDEVKREQVLQWLAKADEDFGLARHLISENSPYLNAICFNSQQAAEKCLKAFLVYSQVEFPKTHDVAELLNLVVTVDRELAESLRDTKILTTYSVSVRYPGDLPEATTEEAHKAFALAGKVRDAVMARLREA